MMRTLEDSMYHRVIRTSALVCALVLLFESGIISQSTARLAQNTNQYLANAVGVGAGVEPTELNTLTAELTSQKKKLGDREAAIREREIEVGLASGEVPGQTTTYVLAGVLFLLLILIVLNYILDYLRSREPKRTQVSISV